MTSMQLTQALVVVLGFAMSLGIGGLLIRSNVKQRHVTNRRNDLTSTQSMHLAPTPRLGGVPILLAIVTALQFVPDSDAAAVDLVVLAALPVVLAGLLEDMGWLITPLGRLIAATTSALIAVLVLKAWIPLSGIAPVDVLFQVPAFAIIFTVLWVAGICHGFNLIDGVNGLVAGLAVLIAAGLAVLALRTGQGGLAVAKLALIPGLAGFLLLNWPRGRIFMGDAGAYGLGFLLVWLAILLAWNAPEVSTVALGLMFFWPVADTLLAIARRLAAGRRIDLPDRLHFHQLVFRLLSSAVGYRLSKVWRNSLAGALTLALAGGPVAAAVLLWDRPMAALFAWAAFGALFVAVYHLGVELLRRRQLRRRPRTQPPAPGARPAPSLPEARRA
jgi:UDP-GlcNAc:undecaprenyl-phosphate/decaprenyl-phosphate GlcNAc-1-phosphate transferase